ncbi:MAG: TMEM14 family protein [Cyanobacteria bacterium P01_H01_bin.15]
MTAAIAFTFIYALLSLVGGVIGYASAKSKVSLISGTVSGLLLLGCGAWQLQNPAVGGWAAIAITAALCITFLVRLYKTRKAMPAGLMIGAGALTLFVLGQSLVSGS